jgi:hypothetical protein
MVLRDHPVLGCITHSEDCGIIECTKRLSLAVETFPCLLVLVQVEDLRDGEI